MSTYYSKYKELRLIVRASRPVNKNGNLEILPGKHINFLNGKYTTDNPTEIAFIEGHPEFNRSVYKAKEAVSEKVEAVKEEVKAVAKKVRKSKK